MVAHGEGVDLEALHVSDALHAVSLTREEVDPKGVHVARRQRHQHRQEQRDAARLDAEHDQVDHIE